MMSHRCQDVKPYSGTALNTHTEDVRSEPITTVMTTDLVSIDLDQPLSEAYHALQGASFEHIPVLDVDRPVGMLSSTDILRLVYDAEGASDKMLTSMLDHQFNIEDAMSSELVTLTTDATVHDAAEILAEGKVHSIVVVDDGKLTGIVTTTDLVRYLRDL
ncbi:MAG: CBS domain-containing protein [Acidimicrobiaceae bacterium]|nr:CBS domain-containing protein [Acidimicrobiaceae bacterium]